MKSNKLSEGQTGTVLLVSVVIGVLLSGFVALAFTQELPGIYGRYVNDAGPITEAEARNDMLEKNYFPLAAHYSFAQGAYEIGQYSGSGDIVLGDDDSNSDDDRSDEVMVHEEMIDATEVRTNDVFEEYLDEYQFQRCKTEMSQNADVEIGLQSTWVNVSTPDDQLVNVTCQTNSMKVRYEGAKDEFAKKAVNNRFHKMSGILSKALTEAENVTETIEAHGNMRGTVTENATCSYSDASNARDDARSNARSSAGEILIQIGVAIIEEERGINGDNSDSSEDRGAEEIIKQETNDNKLCVPYVGCVTIKELDIIFRNLNDNVYVESNQTQINEQNTYSYSCGCTNWECNYNDGDAEEEFEATDGVDYSEITESGDVSCEFQKSDVNSYPTDPKCTNDDFSHDDFGSCTLDESPPPVCDVGSWNGTHCESGGSIGSTTYCDENIDGDDEFSRSGSSCVHNDAPESPECRDDDLRHDGGGGCEFNDPSNSPVPTCSSSNERYNADSTYDYEMDRITGMIKLIDDEMKIPVSDGFTHLEVARKYRRVISDDPEH